MAKEDKGKEKSDSVSKQTNSNNDKQQLSTEETELKLAIELSKEKLVGDNSLSEGEGSLDSIDEAKTIKTNTSEGINSELFYTKGYVKFINDCKMGKISKGFAIEVEKMLWAKLWSPEFYETQIDHKDSLSIEAIKASMATFCEMKSIAANMDGEEALSSIINHMNDISDFSYFDYLQYINAEKIAEYFALTDEENHQRFLYYITKMVNHSEIISMINTCIKSLEKQSVNEPEGYNILMQLRDLFGQYNIILNIEELEFLNNHSIVFKIDLNSPETVNKDVIDLTEKTIIESLENSSDNNHDDLTKITTLSQDISETTISADEDAELMAALAMSLQGQSADQQNDV